jgi:hypothetical protein
MGPRLGRNTAEKRPIVGHMFKQLALGANDATDLDPETWSARGVAAA